MLEKIRFILLKPYFYRVSLYKKSDYGLFRVILVKNNNAQRVKTLNFNVLILTLSINLIIFKAD